MKLPQLNEVWTHFKGEEYRICAFAWCAVGADLSLRVLYQKDGTTFSRTISNFLEPVDGRPRFEYKGVL